MAGKGETQTGNRASAAARKRAEEARGADYRASEIADYRNAGEAPDPSDPQAFVWLSRIAMRAVEGAATDPGLTPEASREQLVRLIPQAVKALDPARLGTRITALESALTDLRESNHAADEPSRENSSARIGAALS